MLFRGGEFPAIFTQLRLDVIEPDGTVEFALFADLRDWLGFARHYECAGRMEALRFVENSEHDLRLLPCFC